jgi:hypothetical protein
MVSQLANLRVAIGQGRNEEASLVSPNVTARGRLPAFT